MRTIYAAMLVHDYFDECERYFDDKDMAEQYVAARKATDTWARSRMTVDKIEVIQDGEDLQNCR